MGDPAQPLCSDLAWLLARASHALNTELAGALEAVGISARHRCVLSAASTGELTQIEIARTVGLDKTTLVVTLDELEARGLAERRPSSTDRRARVVHVTPAGQRLLREAEQVSAHVQREVLASLPGDQGQALVDALAGLVRGRLAEPVCTAAVRRPRAA